MIDRDRRRMMVALGAVGAGSLVHGAGLARLLWSGMPSVDAAHAQAAGRCVLTPEQTEGPYYLEDEPFRRRIHEGRPGFPLIVNLKIQDAAACTPIAGAVVEIWHADASGAYSGFGGASNDTFMRGRQVSGAGGRVRFRTVYPGWYRGRTTHIHVKVHAGGDTVHTGQLYFDDTVTDDVYALAPYVSRGTRDTDNASDGVFAGGGAQSLLSLRAHGDGLAGRLTLGVEL